MNRISICTVLFLLTSTAAAQDVLRVTAIGGESLSSSDVARVGTAECDSNVTITVNVDVSVEEVDLWFGGNTVDCSTVEARDDTAGESRCRHVGHPDQIGAENSFEFNVQSLINEFPGTCTANENDVAVYALYTTANVAREAVDAFGVVNIEFDGIAPEAPEVSNNMISGDSQATLNWGAIIDENASFEVLLGGACGAAAPENTEAAIASSTLGSRSVTISPGNDLGLAQDQSAAVYVVAVDRAGNRSVVSGEVCVTRVAVAGFCDVFTEMGGADCGEAGCSVAAPGSGGSSAPLFFVLVALLWTRRS